MPRTPPTDDVELPEEPLDLDLDDGPSAGEERLHPVLSNAEAIEARARAKAKVLLEQKKAALKQIEEEETQRLRVQEGLTTGSGPKDEMVSITIDLPPYADRTKINSVEFFQGHTYTVPRHQGDTLKEIMDRAWKHEDEIKGRSLTEHYGSARNVSLNGVTGNVTTAPKLVHAA